MLMLRKKLIVTCCLSPVKQPALFTRDQKHKTRKWK